MEGFFIAPLNRASRRTVGKVSGLNPDGVTRVKTFHHWSEIRQLYDVKGLTIGQWRPFKRNVNYDAFILTGKKVSKFGITI